MRRRNFLSTMAVGGLAALGADELARGAAGASRSRVETLSQPLQKIGRWSLEEVRGRFRKELETDVLAYWDKYGVDREYGGYLRADKKTGVYATTDKDLYSQGRILWIYSYLYNHFGQKKAYLEAARQGKEALVKHALLADGHWGTLYTRDWQIKQGFFDIYADIYMVLGLAEYFKASGDKEARRLAVRTSYLANKIILAPDFQGQGHGPFYEPGVKRLGTWVHFLFPLTLLLQYTKDEGLESIARMCVRNIIQYHWNRKEGFAYECLDNLYKPYSNNYLSRTSDKPNYGPEFISGWHSIQGAFKVMLEALRVQSLEMFEDGLEFGYQVFDTHWKESEPCGFDDYQNVEDLRRRRGIRSIADYAIYDFLVFSLLALEHTLSARAVGCFEKAYLCALSKPEGIYTGSLTLHEPRGVMFCLEILDRIAGRNGRASGFLGSERKFEEST